MQKYFYFFARNTKCALVVAVSEKKQVPFSVAIGNGDVFPNTCAWEQQE